MNKKIFIILIPVLVCCAFFNNSYASSNTTISIPTISIKDASDIKNNQATLNARIDSINNIEYIEWWFEYGVLENNLFSKTDVTKETSAKDISYTLSNLSPDSLYFYRFCEKNIYETSCTAKKSFKTYSMPIVDISQAADIGYGAIIGSIGYGKASIRGRIVYPGIDDKGYGTSYWFEYGVGSSLTNLKSTDVKITNTQQDVIAVLDNLMQDTEYYYRLCAKNNIGQVCSDKLSFKTYTNVVPVQESDKPGVETLEPLRTSIANSIKIQGRITKMGMYPVLSYYFEYDENLNFRNKIDEGKTSTQTITFDYTLSNLEYNKTYYYRACVKGIISNTNSEAVVCGEPKVFTITDYKNKSLGVSNYGVTKVTDTMAKIAGIVNGFGGYDDVNAWFIIYDNGYGNNGRETDKIQVKGTSIIFSTDVTGLTPGKQYFYSTCVANNSIVYCSNDRSSFYTLKNPSVEISDYSISGNKLYLFGKASNNLSNYGYGWFEYASKEDLSDLVATNKVFLSDNKLKGEISNLSEYNTYYMRFCVNIGLDDACSNAKKIVFTKTISEPKIEILDIDKNQNNIIVKVIVDSFGGDEKIEAYLEYGLQNSKLNQKKDISILEEGESGYGVIDNMKYDTKYYYRFCAKNSKFTKCSDTKEILIVSDSLRRSIPKMDDDDKANFFIENDFAEEKAGQILFKSQDPNNLWYVNPKNLKRYLLGGKDNFYLTFEKLLNKTTEANLSKIPIELSFGYGKDTDQDGIIDQIEKAIGTNYLSKDTDKDGFNDFLELKNNYSPNNKKPVKLSFDNNVIKNSIGQFYITDKNDIWYVNKNRRRYYLGNTSDKPSIFNSLKQLSNKIDYEDLIRIDYVDTSELFSDISGDSDYDGVLDKYEINL
ncbi:MAG TPA: fibronectin type III domain-containing protein [bacterium]|nr:fibronectin type III domain-containing protein [bacterium]